VVNNEQDRKAQSALTTAPKELLLETYMYASCNNPFYLTAVSVSIAVTQRTTT